MPAPIRIDIRQLGGGIDPDQEDDAILANPHAAYFPGVAPAGGYPYPRYGSSICYIPASLHVDYDGDLYQDQIRDLIMKHMASGEYPLIRIEGAPEWVSILPLEESVRLTWHTEAPTTQFRLYRSLSKDQGFTLLSTISQAAGDANNVFTDTSLTSGIAYFYYLVTVDINGVEGPQSKVYGARAL